MRARSEKAIFKLPVKRYGILSLIAITGRFIVGQKRFRLYIDMGNVRKRIFDALFLMLLFFFVRYVLKSAAAA